MPVNQDALKTFTLHFFKVNLNLPEHEVVRLGVSVTQGQHILQTTLIEDVEDVEESLVNLAEEGSVVEQAWI